MRNIFKFLATAMIAAIIACAVCTAGFAANTQFKDVSDSDETLSEAVALLSHLEITKGTSDTTFGTNENVTRQQMAAFAYRLLKGGKSLENVSNTTTFTDLKDSTYFGYISWANATGVIKGKSETVFDPEAGITLQDAYTMVVRALGYDDGSLQYPYGYIDIAESEDVRLDEGLPSSVNYDTTLTRGNVAVILYNAFFAETAHEETKQVERLLGGKTWVLEKKTYNLTLAEYAYDVEVGDFVVRATPKYCFNDSYDSDEYVPLDDYFEEDNLQLVAVESDEPVGEFFAEFENCGLDGKADDFIMSHVKVYYTYETKNGSNEVTDVLFVSDSRRTLETNNATFTFTTGNSAENYLGTSTNKDPEGYLTINNEKIYFFDAPYSYIQPDYSVTDSEDERYLLRNEKNVKFIDLKCIDTENETFGYYITDKTTDTPEEMYKTLIRVFSRGAYNMKFYDVDGDGVYEYLHYMPAIFGQMDSDEDFVFMDDMPEDAPVYEDKKDAGELDLKTMPKIYYNEATVLGESFFDGDFVIAYINPEANIIDVFDVVTPYNGYVASVKQPSGSFKMDGTTFTTAYSYRVVENLESDGRSKDFAFGYHSSSDINYFATLTSASAIGEEFDVYAYKMFGYSNVLYYEHKGDSKLGYSKDEIIIPVYDEENVSGGNVLLETKFDGKLGTRVTYAKVYLNGKETFVPLDIDEMYPELEYVDGGYTISVMDGDTYAYLDKLCTFSVDKSGLYTIQPLMHAYDDDGDYIGVNRDSSTLVEKDNSEQFGNDFGYERTGKVVKVSGTRYQLVTPSGTSLLGDPYSTEDDAATVTYFTMNSNTKIIIKNIVTGDDEDEVEYLEFDASTFGETSDDTLLTNIQYVLKGDPDSKIRAQLLILYAEAEDFEFAAKEIKNGYRIVASATPGTDEEGDYRNFYTVLDPFTGTIVEDVPGNEAKSKSSSLSAPCETGTVVEIKGGYVDEDDDFLGDLDTSDNESGLVWITEYDADDSLITVVPTSVTEELCCQVEFNELVETWTYVGTQYNFDGERFIVPLDEDDNPVYGKPLSYEITSDTVVSVLSYDEPGTKTVKFGEFKVAETSVLADAKKDYKCYNEKVVDAKGNYSTKYAEYIKAYVSVSEADDEQDTPVVDYIIIVVNGEEATATLETKCPEDIHE